MEKEIKKTKPKCELYLDHTISWGGDGYFCSECGEEFIMRNNMVDVAQPLICEHTWNISSFELYPEMTGEKYCYVICIKCGEVKKQKIR